MYAFKQDRNTQIEIAIEIEVHKSTVSREIKRNQDQRAYRPKQAQGMSGQRREDARFVSELRQR